LFTSSTHDFLSQTQERLKDHRFHTTTLAALWTDTLKGKRLFSYESETPLPLPRLFTTKKEEEALKKKTLVIALFPSL
jgi:hypothetical protein